MVGGFAPERPRALGRLLRSLVPPGRGEHEQLLGPGEGDVEQPPLVLEGAFLQLAAERPGVAGEAGQVAGVLAQLVGEPLGAPRVGDPGVREDPVPGRAVLAGAGREPDDRDHRELQPLGHVHGHQLDRVHRGGLHRLDRLGCVLDGVQVGQEGGEGRVALDGGEGRHPVEEGGEVLPGRRGPAVPGRLQLRPDPGALQDGLDQVEQRAAGGSAQLPELLTERVEPVARLLVQALDLVQVVERLGEGEAHVARVGVLPRQHVLEPPVVPGGPAGQPDEVPRADPPARAEQEPGQGDVGARVGHHAQGGDEVDDLGRLQQAGQADHLDRDAALLERLPQGAEEPLGPDKDGHVPPLRPGAVGQAGLVGANDLVGDERRLGELVGEQGRPDLAVGGAGPGHQRRPPAPLLGDPVDDRVGEGQDPRPRPEVGRQRQRHPHDRALAGRRRRAALRGQRRGGRGVADGACRDRG